MPGARKVFCSICANKSEWSPRLDEGVQEKKQCENMATFVCLQGTSSLPKPRSDASRVCSVRQRHALHLRTSRTRTIASANTSGSSAEEYDVVIVGSGFGGLCCAAITTSLGFKTLVLESHYAPGGVAHGFEVKNKAGTFHFDTGPSFFCGLSQEQSLNPLKMCLDAVGEKVECVPYDYFCIDDVRNQVTLEVNSDENKTLSSLSAISPNGVEELRRFNKAMRDIHAGMTVPSIALRGDWRLFPIIFSRWAASMLQLLPHIADVKKPVSAVAERCGVKDPFVKRILDLEAFLLSGLKADGTITAEIAFMVGERSKKGAVEYPISGAKSIVDALVRGIERHGSEVRLNSHVREVILENGAAVGVTVQGRGKRPDYNVLAKRAVISNASIWDTFGSFGQGQVQPGLVPSNFASESAGTPAVESFMHAHLAIPSAKLDSIVGHHAVVIDSSKDIASPGNTVMISIPTVWSPEMAPPGWHVIHAYTLESFDKWPALSENRSAYDSAKQAAAKPLFTALRHVIPDLESRLGHPHAITKLGSPVTHARYCRRYKGSYGPALAAGVAEFPWPKTSIRNLYRVGDSVFPGIGVPAAACSGIIAGTSLVGFRDHSALIDRVYPRPEKRR